jgi:hypothetical protein
VSAIDVVAVEAPTISEELKMQAITIIGLDIAKSVFQVLGVGCDGQVVPGVFREVSSMPD